MGEREDAHAATIRLQRHVLPAAYESGALVSIYSSEMNGTCHPVGRCGLLRCFKSFFGQLWSAVAQRDKIYQAVRRMKSLLFFVF